MRGRTATFAVAAALGLFAAGCGDEKCNEQTPPVASGGVPSCTAAAGATVSVPIRVCPKCDQGTPQCTPHLEDVGAGVIQLEPLSEVCDPSSSCPIVNPSTCAASPVVCTFRAPATPDTYDLVVITPEGGQVTGTLTVTGSGTGSSCSI